MIQNCEDLYSSVLLDLTQSAHWPRQHPPPPSGPTPTPAPLPFLAFPPKFRNSGMQRLLAQMPAFLSESVLVEGMTTKDWNTLVEEGKRRRLQPIDAHPDE